VPFKALILAALVAAVSGSDTMPSEPPDFLPSGTAAQSVGVVAGDAPADAALTILTQAVAVKETGPAETLERFGEVYAFNPAFIAVHRDEPTEITFWNLQADDEHDFMLADPDLNVVMKAALPALRKTTFVFTFHREGLFTFYCTMHQPEMSGQILVLPAARQVSRSPSENAQTSFAALLRTPRTVGSGADA